MPPAAIFQKRVQRHVQRLGLLGGLYCRSMRWKGGGVGNLGASPKPAVDRLIEELRSRTGDVHSFFIRALLTGWAY